MSHEAKAEALRAEQIERGSVLDERRSRIDVLSRFAHDRRGALLYTGSEFETVPIPPPGEALPTWPETS
jgi:hypothetical protein